jgi:nucleotide-binding universal stress UspA family protein
VEAGARGVAHVLRQLGDEIRLAGDLEVRSVVLKGDPVSVLSELGQDFDLIAVGVPKRQSFGRFLTGSVSADVLREAGGRVLIAPDRNG